MNAVTIGVMSVVYETETPYLCTDKKIMGQPRL